MGVFAVYAAPVVLSGQATFAGYITLDDTATWLALTDRVMDHGRTSPGWRPSSYEAMLDDYFRQSGYPIGAFLPLGVGGSWPERTSPGCSSRTSPSAAAMLALSLYELTAAARPRTAPARAVRRSSPRSRRSSTRTRSGAA